MTHEVAPKLRVGVRTIGHKRLSQRLQESQNLRFPHFQPRPPHPIGANGAHRRKPTQSRTAQQAQQQRLCLIFGMMSHKNRTIQLRKPRITQASRRHFETFAGGMRLIEGIKVAHPQRDVVPPAKISHETFVALTLLPSKMKIHVSSRERQPKQTERTGHCHGIGSAAQRTIQRAVRARLACCEKITNRL